MLPPANRLVVVALALFLLGIGRPAPARSRPARRPDPRRADRASDRALAAGDYAAVWQERRARWEKEVLQRRAWYGKADERTRQAVKELEHAANEARRWEHRAKQCWEEYARYRPAPTPRALPSYQVSPRPHGSPKGSDPFNGLYVPEPPPAKPAHRPPTSAIPASAKRHPH